MRPTRRFTIADVMILVPAAAVGALILKPYLPGFSWQLGYIPSFGPDPWGLWRAYLWLHGVGSCLVVPWMAAMIVIRLRRPRPRLVRFQPGFVACVAVMASLVPGLAWIASIYHRPGFQRPQGFEQAWAIATSWTDAAVLGAWLALWLGRKWRPEPSWIDRMGRALGLYWIVLLAWFLGLQGWQTLQQYLTGGA
ncbi:hypothetical protein P12x_005655 [Tundrisphaera lichenicola]|uniref:hypothetical protein n=1 Tax=Tundrisphaera lichenicola TaxID=2029860 RepID=UPI003EB7FE62